MIKCGIESLGYFYTFHNIYTLDLVFLPKELNLKMYVSLLYDTAFLNT